MGLHPYMLSAVVRARSLRLEEAGRDMLGPVTRAELSTFGAIAERGHIVVETKQKTLIYTHVT